MDKIRSKILISGAGIAGPALAYWLCRYGFEPTLIEEAPQLRTGGYMIDFWGIGYTVAERMGILPAIKAVGYTIQNLSFVNDDGKTLVRAPMRVFHRLTHNRFTSVPRGDLAVEIYKSLKGSVETLFGTTIERIKEHERGVTITLSNGTTREFDLVIGADGLHSRVRGLVFGPEEHFEKQLGFTVAAFVVKGYPHRDEMSLVGHSRPGRQIMRVSKRDDETLFLLVFLNEATALPYPANPAERKAVLRDVFEYPGWECNEILDVMDSLDNIYFDRVSQIKMDHWSQGRSALIGDAGACVSLLAGEGTGLAMAEAYVLAGELHRADGDYVTAFQKYEALMHEFIEAKQDHALTLASAFAPKNRFNIWVRNMGLRLFNIPGVANLLIGANVKDDFVLPEYDTSQVLHDGEKTS